MQQCLLCLTPTTLITPLIKEKYFIPHCTTCLPKLENHNHNNNHTNIIISDPEITLEECRDNVS